MRKSDLSLRVKGKLQERRPSRRGKKSPRLMRANKRRERRSASGPALSLPKASAHVSLPSHASDLITTRPPLLYTVPVHGPENHRNIPNHRSGATGHYDNVIASVGLPPSCARPRCPCRSSSSSRASVSRRDAMIVRYSAFAKAGGTALPTCLRTPRSEN